TYYRMKRRLMEMNGKLILAEYSQASTIALCFLMVLSFTVVCSAVGLPPNKTPFALSGPEIRITAPPAHQAQLTSETGITYDLGNFWPGVEKVKEYPHIILAIYEDGTLIWSDDHIKGGPPYHLARLPTQSV